MPAEEAILTEQPALLTRAADNVRALIVAMVEKARSGHPGGSMGGADFTNVLFSQFMVYDPDDPAWIARDRFFLDPGHMSPMLYAVLAMTGRYTMDQLRQFRQWGAVTPGHPELDPARGVDNTSGPLGQGHAMAVGCALAERFLVARFGQTVAHKTYAFISDGGIQEGISQGAGRIAGHLGLSQLIMFYDANGIQLSTTVEAVDTEDVAAKYRAWGWDVIDVDGGDPSSIAGALAVARAQTLRPTLIIGRTVMGRGCRDAQGRSMEGLISTHGQPLSKAGVDVPATLAALGADPEDPWQIAPEVQALYDRRRQQLRRIVAGRRAAHARWAQDNPALEERLQDFIHGRLPRIDYAAIVHKAGCATRNASSDVLAVLAQKAGNMIVSSADLANSDKTDGFIKGGAAPLAPHDFAGAFLHAGVSELTMAAIANGIVLHGAMTAACGTFFVFSDYMKPAIRMSALMRLPVKYVWSHDSFRVGEDGPTHQPIEHEAQLRLMESIRNPDGRPSLLVFRPADAAETTAAWQLAMENQSTPTALVLTRQDVDDIPATLPGQTRFQQALEGTRRGGYVVAPGGDPAPAVTLVADGSEVTLALAAARLLRERHGLEARVVSVPSIGLFNAQPAEYRRQVIPPCVPTLGITAGLPVTLRMIDGWSGDVYGLERYGASAPAKVLDHHFGFEPEHVMELALRTIAQAPRC